MARQSFPSSVTALPTRRRDISYMYLISIFIQIQFPFIYDHPDDQEERVCDKEQLEEEEGDL